MTVTLSTYRLPAEGFEKAICALAEKCFSNQINLTILVEDEIKREAIDRTLWTFSQKKFIPHGTNSDEFADKQPILITTILYNANNSTSILIINQKLDIEELIKYKFEKIMIMYDSNNSQLHTELKKLIAKVNNSFKLTHYEQTLEGTWKICEF